MPRCMCCKGTAIQHVTVHDISVTGTVTSKRDQSCMWCKGTGYQTKQEREEWQAYMDAWCYCDVPGPRINYYEANTVRVVCGTCGKFIQV